jgi:hypothetical protein
VLFSDASTYPECGSDPEEFSANDGKYPVAAPDGTLYVMVSCGGHAYLARSTDEAKTFRLLHVGGHALTVPVNSPLAELRIADDGAFYLAYGAFGGTSVRLWASADRGRTWTRGANITPPGITSVQQWAVDIASPSSLVVTYLAHRRGQTTWDGYVSVTRNARAALSAGAGPLFWSAQVNPPNRPLLFGNDIEGAGQIQTPTGYTKFPSLLRTSQSLGDEFIGATIAYDGTPWGSFTEDCGPAPTSPGCRADGDQTRGYAGYLAWLPPVPQRAINPKSQLAATGLRYGVPLAAAALLGIAALLNRGRVPRRRRAAPNGVTRW